MAEAATEATVNAEPCCVWNSPPIMMCLVLQLWRCECGENDWTPNDTRGYWPTWVFTASNGSAFMFLAETATERHTPSKQVPNKETSIRIRNIHPHMRVSILDWLGAVTGRTAPFSKQGDAKEIAWQHTAQKINPHQWVKANSCLVSSCFMSICLDHHLRVSPMVQSADAGNMKHKIYAVLSSESPANFSNKTPPPSNARVQSVRIQIHMNKCTSQTTSCLYKQA